jgi:hypothetical protein
MSRDGRTMYVNKDLPKSAMIEGRKVDVADMLFAHEVPEWRELQRLLLSFRVSKKREPNESDRKAIYLSAHRRYGTPNERAHAKKIGVNWMAWSAWCRGEESKIERGPFRNQPKDADVKPIPHSHNELAAVA